MKCWCGAVGTYDEMFDEMGLDGLCGGLGTLYCHCGGGICICHHHGEIDCPGCEDCAPDDFDTDDFDTEEEP